MAGSKREVRDGVWELRVYIGRDPVTGHKRWVHKTVHGGARESGRALAALVTDVERQGLGGSRASVAYLLREFVAIQVARGRWSENYLRTVEGFVRNWILPAVGDRRIDKLTAGDIETLFARMQSAGLSASAQAQVRATLSGALKWAMANEWVGRNVARLVSAPSIPSAPVTAPPPDVVTALVSAAEKRTDQLWLASVVALAALTGARVGELTALRWSDVDLGAATLSIGRAAYRLPGKPVALKAPKTDAGNRAIALDDLALLVVSRRMAAQVELAERVGVPLAADPYVLSRSTSATSPPSPHALTNAFYRLRRSLGYGPEVHLHALRHFSVTQMLGAGVDVRTVAGRHGHANPAVTLRVYASFLPERDREAAAVLGRVLTPALPGSDANKPPLRP